MPPPVVAALDADVLVPIIACDFLLTTFDHGLYEPVVSATALDEVERALSDDFPNLTADAVRYRVDAMRDALADHVIDVDPNDAPDAINAKDRHVVAAALVGEAAVLVANDNALRQQINGAGIALRAVTLDDFGLELWEQSADGVNEAVDALVSKRLRPPVTREAMLAKLANPFPRMIAAITDLTGTEPTT
jgi:hypothetical protein